MQIISEQVSEGVAAEDQVSIPRNVLGICEHDPDKAKALQVEIRHRLQRFFAEGFTITGFELNEQSGKYLLQRI